MEDKNKIETAQEELSQEQPRHRNYDFTVIVKELHETLAKHEIYMNQFDQVMEQLRANIMRDSKIQKEN